MTEMTEAMTRRHRALGHQLPAASQWLSPCGPWVSNPSITWEPVRNAHSLAHLRPTQLDILRLGREWF